MAFIAIALLLLSFELHCFNAQTWIRAAYWYSGPELPVQDIDSTLFTHLLCGSAHINASTNQLYFSSSDEQYFPTFTDIVKRKNPSIKTLLSISDSGETSPIFFTMISKASYRKSFIESSIKAARFYGFHGLDLFNVKPRNDTDMTSLEILLDEWRDAVNSEARNSSLSRLILTLNVPYVPTLASVSYPVESIKRNLDWVHILSYDYYESSRENFTRAHAALYDPASEVSTDFGIREWLGRGLPANQLVLGLPYHGYAWTLVNPKDNGFGKPASGPALTTTGNMGYSLIKSYIRGFGQGAASVYNSTYVVNYCSSGKVWIDFDDVEAIRTKISYAKEKRLLGYCVSHLIHDDNWLLSREAAQAEDTLTAQAEDVGQRNIQKLLIIILLPVSIGILLCPIFCYLRRRTLTSAGAKSAAEDFNRNAPNLQAFSFANIKAATNNFSSKNKLGEGGFGPVYKGKLPKGQEIAVKRLSKTSNQGLEEFKNEVTLTAKLQHVNLVRVLGFCIERKEKMLIYEYMPKQSLDLFLFDPNMHYQLDWAKRINIIEGVTQALLYLQEYSNLTVIHRDLKASNILLDNEMNPKISDFGMARTFRKEEHEANTGRIVGTYGYVPPEYVKKGLYSAKFDVYSFGVLLLQIISNKKNTRLYGPDENLNLLDYAYELWKNGRSLEFIDPSLDDSSSPCKLLRCFQIGLLCVQEDPVDRPTMLEVSSMLKNENLVISTPKKPAFSITIDKDEDEVPVSREEICSVNNTTMSQIVPR